MSLETNYQNAKQRLLFDESICEENRQVFKQYFEHQEYKLKRINRLAELDEATYKTLLFYVSRLRTVNRWFQNRPWITLTKEDIKLVYDGVEDGTITKLSGKPFQGKDTYYDRILCGKPFALAGKAVLATEVMEFRAREKPREVRFIKEESFRRIVDVVIKPEHKALLWLEWDIGENARSLLQLRSSDFTRQANRDSKDPEYVITLRREILKRSRTSRTEITNHKETVQFLDLVLAGRSEDDFLFAFGSRMAMKVLDRATRITGTKCIPEGQKVTLKDLRSSMACDLLSKGWTTDEVNQRLGHKPSSREIDKYVNWLALDRHRPKRKFHENHVRELEQQVIGLRDREKLAQQRQRELRAQFDDLRQQTEKNNRMLHAQAKVLWQIRERVLSGGRHRRDVSGHRGVSHLSRTPMSVAKHRINDANTSA